MAWAAQQHEIRLKRKREAEVVEVVDACREKALGVLPVSSVCEGGASVALVPRRQATEARPSVALAALAASAASAASSAWCELHRPALLIDVVGNGKAKEQVMEWAAHVRKPLLLTGPVGVGKTALAWALCRSKGWVVVEPQTAPGTLLSVATDVLTRKRNDDDPTVALMFDDVDSWHANERTEVCKLVKRWSQPGVPVVFVSDDVGKGMESVRALCQLVRMYRGERGDEVRAIATRLNRLTSHVWSPSVVAHITHACCGDLRKAVMMLQMACTTSKLKVPRSVCAPGSSSDVFVDSLFDAAECLLSNYPRALSVQAKEDVFSQHDLMLCMLHENVPLRHADAMDTLSVWFSDMSVLDAHPSHHLHHYPGALVSHLFSALPPVSMRKQRLQFPAYLSSLSRRKSFQSTLHQCRMSYDDWSLLAPAARTHPEIFSSLVDVHNQDACPDFGDAVRKHRSMQSVLGNGAP